MANTSISNQIYLSRDQIRQQISDYAKTYLELENVDLAKSSFLSYLINVFSSLTSNILFYQLSTSREFFLTEAQLPENILNLSAYIGYTPKESKYSTTDVFLKFPMTFSTTDTIEFSIGSWDPVTGELIPFKFKTPDSIIFTTYYVANVSVINNTKAVVTLTEKGTTYLNTYTLPVDYSTDSKGNKYFNFIIPVRQYSINKQEYQLESTLQDLQFVTVDIPLDGKVSSMNVTVFDNKTNTETTYTEFSTLFLMGPDDYGYVSRKTNTGRRLYFGNGLIGKQPPAGGTVHVTISETLGSDGNIISGSINSGDRLYATENGTVKNVNYTVTNPIQASGGSDEESLDEIKRNAIANIVALKRLVTESDFINANSIIEDSPLGQNSLPILKRSDIKNNEIALFTTLLYSNKIVPTRNIHYVVPNYTTKIERGTVINYQGTDYLNIWNIYIDSTSEFATYEYIMDTLNSNPILETNFGSSYNFMSDNVTFQIDSTSSDTAKITMRYVSSEIDSTGITAIMEIPSNGGRYNMTAENIISDSTSDTTATLTTFVTPYEKIPDGEQKFIFYIYAPGNIEIGVYSVTITFRQLLDDFMISSSLDDGTNITIYDLPSILNSYYQDPLQVNKIEFESVVLQKLLTTTKFSQYKMTTDFINIKFSNTTGILSNMKFNKVTRVPVLSLSQTSVPSNPILGDRYIVNGNEGSEWTDKQSYFAEWYQDGTSAPYWLFTFPSANDIVQVVNPMDQDNEKKFIFTDIGWRFPQYNLPLDLEIHVFKNPNTSISFVELTNTVKSTVYNAFKDRFGISISLYKSEIISVVQAIEGVSHCRVIRPDSDIFFNYSIKSLSQDDLLKYGPEYVFFTEDSITVKILST